MMRSISWDILATELHIERLLILTSFLSDRVTPITGSVTFCFRIVATRCNRRAPNSCGPAPGAISTDFQTAHDDVELAITLDLSLQAIEEVAFELRDLATPEARHVDVIAVRPALIEVLFALHVHKVEFIHQAMALEQT